MLRIKQMRTEKNLSQRALASKINASQKTVNLWERGISEPSAGFVTALADVFECTTDYILGREDDLGNVNVLRGLSDDEKQWLYVYSAFDRKEREEIKVFADYLLYKRQNLR